MPIWNSPEETLPAKRKRTLNSKLATEDNVHQDAVKRRKFQTAQQKTGIPTQNSQTSKQQNSSRQVSVEEVNDKDNHVRHAGPPKNPNAILEQSDSSDDEIEYVSRTVTPVPANDADGEEEGASEKSEEELQEETDEQELGNL
jgi:hypothetical protein